MKSDRPIAPLTMNEGLRVFLLDTDHIGVLQWQTEPEFSILMDRMGNHDGSDVFVSIISFHEQVSGWNAYISIAQSHPMP